MNGWPKRSHGLLCLNSQISGTINTTLMPVLDLFCELSNNKMQTNKPSKSAFGQLGKSTKHDMINTMRVLLFLQPLSCKTTADANHATTLPR